jgi:hypothetical protein
VTGVDLKEKTYRISARTGVRFGVRYRIVGQPADADVKVKLVIRFPPAGLRNPQTGTPSYSDESTITRKVGKVTTAGFGFDRDWEMVPGIWTIEIWDGNRRLLEQRFTVVKP